MGAAPVPGIAAQQPIITEAWLRERVRRPERGLTVELPPGARLSPAAMDFVRAWDLDVPEAADRPARGGVADALLRDAPEWDRPGAFPVVLDGPLPRCEVCGAEVTDKPDHLTQLDAGHYAAKSHPRIALRGKLDTVHGLALLVAARAQACGEDEMARHLATTAAYCREIQSAEYASRAVAPLELAGYGEPALHAATHDPDGWLGVGHVVPDERDPELLHWLAWLRCEAREAELVALQAAGPAPGPVKERSVAHALNRLSSGVYLLMLLLRAAGAPGEAR